MQNCAPLIISMLKHSFKVTTNIQKALAVVILEIFRIAAWFQYVTALFMQVHTP